MPDIRLENAPSAGLTLTEASYHEDDYLSRGAMGAVFRGEGRTSDGARVPIAIKLPATFDKEYLIEVEYELSKDLVTETKKLLPPSVHGPFTPEVMLGRSVEQNVAVLIMPLYEKTLVKEVHALIHAGHYLEADQLAVKHAISYTYILEALHNMGNTCTDRKVGDLFIHEDRLTVIDWNVLKDDNQGNRQIEIEIAFGQIWFELYLGRRSLDAPIPLLDQDWYPATYQVDVGVPSLALRYVLALALQPNLDGRFNGNPAALRHILEALSDIFVRVQQGQAHHFPVDFFAPYLTLTQREADAVFYDMQWRAGVDPDDITAEQRNDIVMQAFHQADAVELAGLLADGEYGKADRDLQSLQDRAFDSRNPILYARLERWKLLIKVLRERDRDASGYIRDARQRLIEMWLVLDGMWRSVTTDMLDDFAHQLDDLLRFIGNVDAAAPLKLIEQEFELRRDVLSYFQTIDAETRNIILGRIEQKLPTFTYLYDYSSPTGGLTYFSDVALDIDYERQQNNARLDIQHLVDVARQDIVQALEDGNYDAVRQRFQLSIQDMARYHLLDYREAWEAEVIPFIDLADFQKFVLQDAAFSRRWLLMTADRLQRHPALMAHGLDKIPRQYIHHALKTALGFLRQAYEQRNITTVRREDADTLYGAIAEIDVILQEPDDIIDDVLSDMDHNLSRVDADRWLADFERMRAFFDDFMNQLRDHQQSNKSIYLGSDPDWQDLLKRAYQEKINMSDLFSNLSPEEWQSLLSFNDVEGVIKAYREELLTRLEDGFKRILDDFHDGMDERLSTVQEQNQQLGSALNLLRRQAILAEIDYHLSFGYARAIAFDLEQAVTAYRTAGQLFQKYEKTFGAEGAFVSSRIAGLYDLIKELEHLRLRGNDYEQFRRASQFIGAGELPEEVLADTELAENLQKNSSNPLVAILHDRYWALRLAKSRELAQDQSLATAINDQQAELKRLLESLRYHFYNDRFQEAQEDYAAIEQYLGGDSLAKVMTRENVLNNWKVRLDNYQRYRTNLERINNAVVSRRKDVNKRNEARADEMLQFIDILIERMRECPTDVFTTGSFQRWNAVLGEAHHLYVQFAGDKEDRMGHLLAAAREEAQAKMRPVPSLQDRFSVPSSRAQNW